MSMIQFTHNLMDGPSEQIPAMNRVKHILREANFTNRVFPMCIGYASWETDEVSDSLNLRLRTDSDVTNVAIGNL